MLAALWLLRHEAPGPPGEAQLALCLQSIPNQRSTSSSRSEQRAHHYVVKQTGPDTLAVSVLGSFKDGGELDLTLFLLAWKAAHPQTTINLEH